MADTKLTPKQVQEFRRLAAKYNKTTAEADELRSRLDEKVAEARNIGETFRAIAALADRSVAWVQGSLERTKNRK